MWSLACQYCDNLFSGCWCALFCVEQISPLEWASTVTYVVLLQRWTETYIRWSPRGTYLATFHQKGIALWGGESMKQIVRFSHPGVQLSDFSPCER